MRSINQTPEQIDALAFELHTMGVQVPPRDTAFFQAAVRKWLATLSNPVTEFVTCGHVGDGPTYHCLLCGQIGTDHPVVLRRALSAARDFMRDRFGHAEAQHDPEALHVLAELSAATDKS